MSDEKWTEYRGVVFEAWESRKHAEFLRDAAEFAGLSEDETALWMDKPHRLLRILKQRAGEREHGG